MRKVFFTKLLNHASKIFKTKNAKSKGSVLQKEETKLEEPIQEEFEDVPGLNMRKDEPSTQTQSLAQQVQSAQNQLNMSQNLVNFHPSGPNCSMIQQLPSPASSSMSLETQNPSQMTKIISLFENLSEELLNIKQHQASQINTMNTLAHEIAAIQKNLNGKGKKGGKKK